MPPLVTLITATYNRASQVTRAIESIRAQTYPEIDIVVIDDGSTDDTQEVLARYHDDPRLRTVRLERNRGVTGAKNAGLAAVSGRTAYVGIVDSDDALRPNAIETLVRVFEESGDRYSQVLGWCVDQVTGERTGEFGRRQGPVTYDDALAGRFAGDFFHLARYVLIADRRFDERASGAESALWWPMLRERDAWLVDAVVYEVDRSGGVRVSLVEYGPAVARGKMWATHAALSAVAGDLRERYPARYGEWHIELAKWAALAGETNRARAAAREALRYVHSPRAVSMAVLAMMPRPLARFIAGWRHRLRGWATAR